ncbi:glycine--tRNA ligase subunit beta, partial [Pseudomonas aeruginosa]
QSCGHRFYAPEPFEAQNLGQLIKELRDRKVEPDEAVRKASIIEQTKAVAVGEPDLAQSLVDENTFLTEWP